jgi:hypothetical protein
MERINVGGAEAKWSLLLPALDMAHTGSTDAGGQKKLVHRQWGTVSCDTCSHLAMSDDDLSVSEACNTISLIIYPGSNAIVLPGRVQAMR